VSIYALVSALWIYTSDTLLGLSVRDHALLVHISEFKGLAFIAVTGSLLYYLIARYSERRRQAEEALNRLNEELEQRVAERTRNLEKSEERFRALVTASADVVYQMSPDWSEMWELQGKHFISDTEAPLRSWLTKYIHPDDQPRVLARIREAIESKGIFELEHRVLQVDGSLGWTFSRAVPIMGEKGEILEWFGAASDVTQRRRTEEALREAYRELERKTAEQLRGVEELRQKDLMLIHQNRLAAMGELLVNIAHHWRQPLNVVGLKLQQLGLTYELGGFSQELLENNIAEGMAILERLSRTIDEFQLVMGPEGARRLFTVQEVIDNVLFMVQEGFRTAGVAIDSLCCCDAQITGDANEFTQVVTGILMNAMDVFVERGTVEARITLRAWRENDWTVVTVTDNAGGIEEWVMDKIFDPYFTTKEAGQGSGLGLFMAKSVVEKKMGGRLSARNVDDGAEFRIEVPDGGSIPADRGR